MRSLRYVTERAVSTARRRPLITSLAAFGAALFAIAGVGSELPGTSSEAAAPAGAFRLGDPDSVFDARSPGGRRYGWLVNTKQPRTGFDVGPPAERVLTSVRQRPVPPVLPGNALVSGYTPTNDTLVPETVGTTGETPLDTVVPTNPGGVFLPGGPVIGGGTGGSSNGGDGDGGGGGETPGGIDPGTPTTSVPPAVPEPSTWTMLILGFFAVGAMTRRRSAAPRLHGAF